jgi:hypothetical protein
MPHPRPKPPAGGIKAAFPGFIEPALATSIEKVPSGERWVKSAEGKLHHPFFKGIREDLL